MNRSLRFRTGAVMCETRDLGIKRAHEHALILKAIEELT